MIEIEYTGPGQVYGIMKPGRTEPVWFSFIPEIHPSAVALVEGDTKLRMRIIHAEQGWTLVTK
jgi:hypothetical protein